MRSRFLFDTALLIAAGAGTGKTWALVTQVLHLVGGVTARRAPVSPSRIAAITFTDKAAAELATRIRARVASLAGLAPPSPDDEAELRAGAAELGVAIPEAAHWESALRELGGAPVGTFHRFAGALLRRHAMVAGIDPGFRTLDESEARELLRRAVESAILDGLSARDAACEALVDELNFDGGGYSVGLVETLLMLHARRAEEGRDARGLADGYAPARMRADLESSTEALREATRTLVALAGSLAEASARRAREIGYELPSLLMSLDASAPSSLAALNALVDGARNLRTAKRGDPEALKAAVMRLRAARDQLAAALVSFRAAPHARALESLLGEVMRRYADDKRRAGALDFADLLVRARDLLRDSPRVRAVERARIDALLVDEFQDTNAVQAELVALLAPVEQDDRDLAGRLFIVGDRKQSIYEFRGADVAVSVAFERARPTVEAGGRTRRIALGDARRSRPSLVHLYNRVFAHLMRGSLEGDGGQLFAVRFRPDDALTPVREGDPLEPRAELLALAPSTSGPRDAETARALEAAALADRIVELRAGADPPRTTAILLRAFTHVDAYLAALRARGVPHVVVNGRGFYEAEEIRDLAAALRLIDDPDDTSALVTVLRSPLVAISDESLAVMALAPGGLGAAMHEPPEEIPSDERERLARWTTLAGDLARRAERIGPAATLRALIEGTQLVPILAAGHHGEQRVANLEALVEKARALEDRGGRAFVRWLAELAGGASAANAAQAQIIDENDDAVRVMTVHQAKGLEFDLVAIAGCGARDPNEGAPVLYDPGEGLGVRMTIAPGERGHSAPSLAVAKTRAERRAAESLRLLYVAMTRARERLLLSGESTGQSSWRALLDGALAVPEIAALVEVRSLRPPPRLARDADRPALAEGDPAAAEAIVARVLRPLPPPREVTIAVTQLADFALCPRRYQLAHVALLDEDHEFGKYASEMIDGDPAPFAGGDRRARGTLAHRLLERADFARAGEDLDELLAAEGFAPDDPEVAEARSHVARFLATPFARALAGPDVRTRRELPFLLSLPVIDGDERGVRVRLRGQIDLVVDSGTALGVIDYKHARAPRDRDAHRLQLDAYALAARHLFVSRDELSMGLVYLREDDPAPRMVTVPRNGNLLDDRAHALAALGARLAREVATGDRLHAGLPEATCIAIGCGYRARCHPQQ